jgi:hypothetical protein
VFDNARYGTIYRHQAQRGSGAGVATKLGRVDFAAVAEACGAAGFRVHSDAELEPAIAAALEAGKPAVLHLHVDPKWTVVGAPPSDPAAEAAQAAAADELAEALESAAADGFVAEVVETIVEVEVAAEETQPIDLAEAAIESSAEPEAATEAEPGDDAPTAEAEPEVEG